MVNEKGQYRIQQMAFMILAVLFFFILVGLFFISMQFKDIKSTAEDLKTEETISFLSKISDMPEFNCEHGKSLCLDEDKLIVMPKFIENYSEFLPVSSLKAYKIDSKYDKEIKCPAPNCNYFEILNSKAELKEFSSFILICKKDKENDYFYEKCEIGKILAGVKNG